MALHPACAGPVTAQAMPPTRTTAVRAARRGSAPAGADGREQAGEEQCADEQDAARIERERPRLPGVRPRPQSMEEGEQVDGEGQRM
jgi:hypothetical protein